MDTQWFKARKKELGIKDQDIADVLGLERTAGNRFINGKTGRLAPGVVARLARLFEVSTAEFVQRAGVDIAGEDNLPLDMKRAPDQMPTRSAYHDAGAVQLRRVNLELAMGDGTTLDDWIEEEPYGFDGIYAITIEGAGAIKRLSPAGGGMIEVISDNPNHPNRVRTFPRKDIRIIGRIPWSARRH